MESMYSIGLDVHKKTIRYCVKDVSGRVRAEGAISATRAGGGPLDENSPAALDGSDGSHPLYRLDL